MTTDTLQRLSGRRAPRRGSAYDVLLGFEQALTESVSAVIGEGLRLAQVDTATRERVASTWREPLLIVAAEELSRRHGGRAGHSRRLATSPSALRRALMPYATLVAAAARRMAAGQPTGSMAAD